MDLLPAARAAHGRAPRASRAATCSRARPRARRAGVRGNAHGDDLPGADDLAQPGLHHRQPAQEALLRHRGEAACGSARARASTCSTASASPPRASRLGPVSPPALGRPAPAGDDRHGAHVRARSLISPTSPPRRSTSPSRRRSCTCWPSCSASSRMGLMLITHDLGVVARIADRVVGDVCGRGGGDRHAPPRSSRAPPHPYTRGLLACIPVPGRTRRGDQLGTIPGIVPSLVGELRGCDFAEPLHMRDRSLPQARRSRSHAVAGAHLCAASAHPRSRSAPQGRRAAA